MKEVILTYVPVIHRGYLEFFRRHPGVQELYIFDEELCAKFAPLRKDLRSLPPELTRTALLALNLFPSIHLASPATLQHLAEDYVTIIMPDEDVSCSLSAEYFSERNCKVILDRFFLRWDRLATIALEEIRFDREVPFVEVAPLMEQALDEADQSSNWWRRVGGVIARESEVLLATHNEHVPSAHLPYVEGDARANFKRGKRIELTTDHHAEARLISEAARQGIALEGTDLYVTTFPCPPCAKLVAAAGIKRLFFLTGYAMLDGERVLKHAGCEIIHVRSEENPLP